ncbi:hypothetical protein EVAR_49503_1 [Eumeta japonica]|uniref:Histone-lysine N-methyltransferase SETMAR n=1 Tax=Eumeta variegata TaxID=151549 RepID=A0A4C1VYX0_EUMVA|nr:hypothetical protein EVAR_49503_1 [Eumeta japonica]
MKRHARRLFITNWFGELLRDRVNFSDEFRDGRPSTAVSNKDIGTVRRMIETDRHATYHGIQAYLGIGRRSRLAAFISEGKCRGRDGCPHACAPSATPNENHLLLMAAR